MDTRRAPLAHRHPVKPMTIEELQSELPSCWRVEEERNAESTFSRDVRVVLQFAGANGEQAGSNRIVRAFKGTRSEDPSHPAMLERLVKLWNLEAAHIRSPEFVGQLCDGTLYAIFPDGGDRLSSRIQAVKGIPPSEAVPLADQLLAGLAALHDRKISHGDIRPENIIRLHGESDRTAWLFDAAAGSLPWWSKGELLDDESRHFWPPEWHGKAQEPSPQADLYALGLSLCEAILGREGNPGRTHCGGNDDAWSQVRKELRHRGAPRPLRRLIRDLLERPSRRPVNAIAALEAHQSRQNHNRRTLTGASALAALLVIAVLALGWRRSVSQNERVALQIQGDLAKVEQDKEAFSRRVAELEPLATGKSNAESALKAAQAERDALRHELDATNGRSPSTPEVIAAKALQAWQTTVDASKPAEALLNANLCVGEWTDGGASGRDLSESDRRGVARMLTQWRDLLKEVSNPQAAYWRDADRRFEESFGEALKNPARLSEISAEITALIAARKKWDEWAKKQLSLADIQTAKEGLPEQVQKIVNQWLAELIEVREWRLQLKSGSDLAGDHGTTREATIYSGPAGSLVKQDALAVHDWTQAKSHAYGAGDAIGFKWAPDESIRLLFEGDWQWSDPRRLDLIDKTYSGALAVWKLNQEGRVGGIKQGSVSLKCEIVNCPGPPAIDPPAKIDVKVAKAASKPAGKKTLPKSAPPGKPNSKGK